MATKEIVLPDYLKDMLDDSEMQSPESLISATSSVPRVSLKGSKFRFIVDGEEISRTADSIHVVIIGVEPERAMCKTWYKDGYQPDSSDPPDCSSSDGVRPDPWVATPQSDLCAKCEKNAWGSAKSMSGGKAKACRDSKRLIIAVGKELAADPKECTLYILNVTVVSLKSLSQYGKLLVANRVPMAAAITTISFDEDADHPKLEFEFKGVLKEKMGKAALARAALKEWKEFSGPALEGPEKTKQLEHDKDDEDEDDDDEEEETEKERKARKKKEKAKKDKAKKAKEEDDDDDDEVVKGELVDDDDDETSPISDVDDLLDGWDD